jgi:hypothetical protein
VCLLIGFVIKSPIAGRDGGSLGSAKCNHSREEDGRFLSFNNTGGELLLLLHDPVSVSVGFPSHLRCSIPFSHLSLSSNRLMNPDRIEADNDRPRPSVNGCLCRVYSCCCCCCGRNNRRSKAARLTEWQRRELITVRDRFHHT